jgi:hypothetical protein
MLPNRPPKIGQRWLYTYYSTAAWYVVEVVDTNNTIRVVVLQNMGEYGYKVGETFSASIMHDSGWSLLKGQDKP